MSDLLDKQEREKELRDFDAVWPGGDKGCEFQKAYSEFTGYEAPKVTEKDGLYTVHFGMLPAEEFTEEQVKSATHRLKTRATLAVQ